MLKVKKEICRFYTDNYFSVLPGESKIVVVDHTPFAANNNVLVSLQASNADERFIEIK